MPTPPFGDAPELALAVPVGPSPRLKTRENLRNKRRSSPAPRRELGRVASVMASLLWLLGGLRRFVVLVLRPYCVRKTLDEG